MESEVADRETKVVPAAHPSLRAQCETRRAELQEAWRRLAPDSPPRTRKDIQNALASLEGLLTGDLDRIPRVVARQLSKWIATSRYLGAKETREAAEEPPAVVEGGAS